MAPNSIASVSNIEEDTRCEENLSPMQQTKEYKLSLVFRNIILFAYLHLIALYGIYLVFTSAKIWTALLAFILFHAGTTGVTAGSHRLWSHRSYKAKWPLRLLLVAMQTLAFQDAVVDWARDHRVHHKYSETDADPHNPTRGLFFAHIGWLLVRKHPDVKLKGKGIDLSDLYADPILKYQKKYYYYLMILLCFILPTAMPMYFWNETFINAFCINITRYTLGLNVIWLINSVAHLYGHKPYDKYINPTENLGVSIASFGEGWHNYHHTFPWDYKTSELGKYSTNITTGFIDLMATVGWAYELKSASMDMIKHRVKKTGDGSHELWGWGDKDQTIEEKREAVITHIKDF